MQVKGRFDHFNINVTNLDKSIAFYKKALGLSEIRRKEASDGSFTLVYLGDESTSFSLELTYLKDRKEPYELGDNESHLCLVLKGTMMKCASSIRKWAASVMKMRRWGFTLFTTPMITGLKFCLLKSK